jgi:hypothetical protein
MMKHTEYIILHHLIEGTSIYLKNSVCQVNYSAHMPLTRECQSKLYKTYRLKYKKSVESFTQQK